MKKNKIVEILIFMLSFVTIISIIILKPINDLDELWNYNFALNFSNGLVPYKDYNMVITPLLSMMCGIVLKLVSNKLIIMRILAATLCSGILVATYKLFNLLEIKKQISFLFCFIIGYLLKDFYCIDYNFASLLITLIIIYYEIKNYKDDECFTKFNCKNDILLGILAGLAILTKQTSGILIAIALLGNKLLFVRKREEFKICTKSFFYRLIGIIIPILTLIIYLILNNAFKEFISYTIMGVKEFDNSISYKSLIGMNVVGILAILVPLFWIYAWIKTVIKEKDKNMYLILVYSLALFVIVFPISNDIHFLIGAIPSIILILYEIYNLINKLYIKFLKDKKIRISKYLFYVIDILMLLYVIIYSICNFKEYKNNENNYSILKPYNYLIINKSLENQILDIERYILNSEKNVVILDSSAVTYMMPINRYHKDYDMFNKGNFGKNGEERIINEISKAQNIQYLILNEKYLLNWQTPLEIINYIKTNKEKIGTILMFDIYE